VSGQQTIIKGYLLTVVEVIKEWGMPQK